MLSELQLDKSVKDLFQNIEFTAEPEGLYDPLRYMISIGGKRIRPKLCLLTYSLFQDTVPEEILEAAAALEVFHTFTLIHDDIMDRSPLRRGQETVWKKWSEDTAILSGDVMLIDSYKRIAKAPKAVIAEAMKLFSDTAAQVCEGQQFDMEFEQCREVPMAEYEKMIGLKTAVLLACSAKMGALLAEADEKMCAALYDYGYQLGMAFQVEDDYLDAFGDQKVFGKPIGGDILNNKKSWILLKALQKAEDKEEIFKAMELPVDTEEQRAAKIAAVKDIYVRLGVDKDALAEVQRYSTLALEAAQSISLGPVREEALHRFAQKLVGRVN